MLIAARNVFCCDDLQRLHDSCKFKRAVLGADYAVYLAFSCTLSNAELAEHGISVIALQPGNIATTPPEKVRLAQCVPLLYDDYAS
jgi:NAD(P)-dependent dehydrogenase (short-subunit alcohol dehydrogenase family)